MQQHEQDQAGIKRRENWLRQKRFALVLSGDDRAANMLVERLSMMGDRSVNPDLSSSAFEYFQLKKLYELWMREAKNPAGDAPIFQAGRENEAIQKGLDPSIAKVMGTLPSLHRALLLLIYGGTFFLCCNGPASGYFHRRIDGSFGECAAAILRCRHVGSRFTYGLAGRSSSGERI